MLSLNLIPVISAFTKETFDISLTSKIFLLGFSNVTSFQYVISSNVPEKWDLPKNVVLVKSS